MVPEVLWTAKHQCHIFLFLDKANSTKKFHKYIKYRPMDNTSLTNIKHHLEHYNWTHLEELNIDEANESLISTLHTTMDLFAPEKTFRITHKNILR